MPDAFEEIRRLGTNYRKLSDAYDEELIAARNAGHDSPECLEHLRKAKAMGPSVMDALMRYHAAVTAHAAKARMSRAR